MHYLPETKLRHFHFLGNRPDWLARVVVNMAWISPTNLVLLSERSVFSGLPFLRNHYWVIQLFQNPLHCPQIVIQTHWNVHIRASGVNATHYSRIKHFRRLEIFIFMMWTFQGFSLTPLFASAHSFSHTSSASCFTPIALFVFKIHFWARIKPFCLTIFTPSRFSLK